MKLHISQRFLIIILLITVIALAAYIGMDKYNGYIVGTMQNAYSLGYQDGVSAAVQQIIIRSQNCNPVPVYIGNVSVNLIDTTCLQQG